MCVTVSIIYVHAPPACVRLWQRVSTWEAMMCGCGDASVCKRLLGVSVKLWLCMWRWGFGELFWVVVRAQVCATIQDEVSTGCCVALHC